MKFLIEEKDWFNIPECLECGETDFTYYGTTPKVVCNNCGSEYVRRVSDLASIISGEEDVALYSSNSRASGYPNPVVIKTKVRQLKKINVNNHSYR